MIDMKTTLIIIFACIILIAILAPLRKSKENNMLNSPNTKNNNKSRKNSEDDSQAESTVNETAGSGEVGGSIIDIDINELAEDLRETYRLALDPIQEYTSVLYALVTCHHCIRTQRYLKSHGVEFKVVHVDLFDGDARKNIMTHLRTLNERGSFPTLVMPTGDVVVGFREQKIREAIEKNESR